MSNNSLRFAYMELVLTKTGEQSTSCLVAFAKRDMPGPAFCGSLTSLHSTPLLNMPRVKFWVCLPHFLLGSMNRTT